MRYPIKPGRHLIHLLSTQGILISDDATLDGGNSSTHGFAEIATLPGGAITPLLHGLTGGAVDFLYGFGAGHVYYWGKHRSVGEATMRPQLVDVLANNQHIVKHVAAAHQAELRIDSELGRGSTFTLVFPPRHAIMTEAIGHVETG